MPSSASPAGETAGTQQPNRTNGQPIALGVLAALGATLFWACNYVLGEYALAEISPGSLTFLRWTIAIIPLFALAAWLERPNWASVLKHWKWHTLQGLLGLSAYNLLLYCALGFTTALNASIINAFNPALIAIGAAIFLRQRLTGFSVVGTLVALVGVITVLAQGSISRLLRLDFGAGELLMIGAIIVFAAYTILGRTGPQTPPITAVAAQSIPAAIIGLVFAAFTGGVQLPQTGPGWGATLFIAILPSVGSYILWNYAMAALTPSKGGVFLNMVTVFTAVITIIWGKPFTGIELIGGAIVIIGVLITNGRALLRRSGRTGRAGRSGRSAG